MRSLFVNEGLIHVHHVHACTIPTYETIAPNIMTMGVT